VTAAVVRAVVRAREAGATLPAGLLDRALDELARMRMADGSFDYMIGPGGRALGSQTRAPGAAGRGPACALALLRGGRAGVDVLRRALDLWLEHRAGLARERGKSLMHTGADGQGSHYLMFDYAGIADAIAALPADQRDPYRNALLQEVLRMRTTEGAFLDTPINGPDYGTAMALRCLRALEGER